VSNEDIIKGYKVDTDTYVTVDRDELDNIALESTRTIDIDEFVPKSDIDELYLVRPYYIVPEGKVGHDAFAVIRETIRSMDKVAIARVVLTNREHIIALEARGKGLGVDEGLRTLAQALLGILLQDRHLAFQRLIIAETARFPALGRAWFESGPERSRSIIAQFIEKQERAGRLRRSDPHQSATLFHDMITFDLLHRAMLGDKPSDDEIRHRIDTAIDAFLQGFARK
jgi:hypothetical protein